MRSNVKTACWILGGLTVAALGMLGAAACGTDNGSSPLPGQTGDDASTKTDTGSTSSSSSSGSSGNADGGDDASNADCGRAPTLRTGDAAGPGPFCLGVGQPDGSTRSQNCGTGEACCGYTTAPDGGSVPDSGFPPSTCQSGLTCDFTGANAAPPGLVGIPFQCTSKSHCPASNECCLALKPGKTFGPQADPPSCPANLKQGNVFGTYCRPTNCNAGETRLCFQDSDCPAAAPKCVPFSMSGRDVGYCK